MKNYASKILSFLSVLFILSCNSKLRIEKEETNKTEPLTKIEVLSPVDELQNEKEVPPVEKAETLPASENVLYNHNKQDQQAPTGNSKHYKRAEKSIAAGSGYANLSAYCNNIRPVAEHNTESYNTVNDNEFLEAKSNPLSTFSIDVDGASYTNSRRHINNGSLPPKDAVRVEEFINYFDYNYPQPSGEHPFSLTSEISKCPWNKDHQLIHIGLQGKKIPFEELPAMNLVFLIDVSGSMNQQNKLPLLKSSLKLLTKQLRGKDKVSITVYAGAAGLVLNSTSGNNKETILHAIENLSAGGSTAGGEGIKLAYKVAAENFQENGINRIVLATDGDFNVGVSSDAEMTRLIEEKRNEGVSITVLGYGMGNYKDSKMEAIADNGNGNYFYIDNLDEARKVLVTEMGGTMNTIAKDVKLQIEFNPGKVKAYRLVGYENRLLKKEDFNNDKKDAGEIGAGHTVTALYEIIPAGSKEEINGTDELKYQAVPVSSMSSISPEIMTIKFRYKKPNESQSRLITKAIIDQNISIENSSENFRFSAAVASFSMLLRESPFKGNSSFEEVLKLANQAKGKDEEGYRAEFIGLVKTASLLKGQDQVYFEK